jgi:hypothetical protein
MVAKQNFLLLERGLPARVSLLQDSIATPRVGSPGCSGPPIQGTVRHAIHLLPLVKETMLW